MKARYMTILFLIIFTLSFNIVVYADAPEGKGTEENPYMIYTVEDLRRVGSDEEWSLDKHYKLMNDIILEKPEEGKSNWTPIGGESGKSFTGTFDGNGKTITGMTITSAYGNAIGLFARLTGEKAMIENLGLLDVKIIMDEYDKLEWPPTGGLVGVNWLGTVRNCYSTGFVSVRTSMLGGLVGLNEGLVDGCYSSVNVRCNDFLYNGSTGGLIGYISHVSIDAVCQKSYATGNVYGTTAGGLIGNMDGGMIIDCYSTASVSGQQFVGGLIGTQNSGTIKNCYVVGNVTGEKNIVSKVDMRNGDAGGICPWPSGDILNCVVLSEKISSYQSIAGEITCYDTSEYTKYNYILEDTTLIYNAEPSKKGNIYRSKKELTSQKFYESIGWKFTGEDAVWEFSGEYKLPKLIGVGGQDELVTPKHLQ